MSDRSTFTDKEWETLICAPLRVADLVGRADDEVDRREAATVLRDLARADRSQEPLVREVLEAASENFSDVVAKLGADSRSYEEGLEDARSVLQAKAGAKEAQSLKRQLLGIGVHVARSSGTSPDRVSEVEKERLAAAAAALDIPETEIFRAKEG